MLYQTYKIGDRVRKIGDCFYSHDGDKTGIEVESIGTVVAIRKRYENTPNAYNLYIVQFDNKPFPNCIDDQYSEPSLSSKLTSYDPLDK